ncbi:hypothetical protein [Actinomadura sp. 6N118]|uniref:hypothetical protein n=1 Tax=Actinomadura sp. 6N118 TaxID=3375151 RepID=UPI0037997D10
MPPDGTGAAALDLGRAASSWLAGPAEAQPAPAPEPVVNIGQITVFSPPAAAPPADALGSLAARRQGRSRHGSGGAS